MSYEFIVSEAKGGKLYKLITVRLLQYARKIVSKEDFHEKIHFCIYMGSMDPRTGEFTRKELTHKSIDEGITKEEFEKFINGLIARLPEETEIMVNDLSAYQTLKEQFEQGLSKKIMEVVSVEQAPDK
jgi:hypothetical protein